MDLKEQKQHNHNVLSRPVGVYQRFIQQFLVGVGKKCNVQICAIWNYAPPLLGLSLLFPKSNLIFYSEFPELLPYYSLRVDPLFHKILVCQSKKMTKYKKNKPYVPEIYMYINKNPTQKS